MRQRARVFGLALLVVAAGAFGGEAKLQEGDFVAVCGDSITEQKLYSVYIEDYLLMCQPAPRLRAMQFGWGGETSWGFQRRMANNCVPFRPSAVTTCYGMNDGGYRPFDPNNQGKRYRASQKAIVQALKKAGARLIAVGSPGVVDAETFRRSPEQAAMYNQTLATLRAYAREVAAEEGVVFANVYDPMMDAMTKAKAKYGKGYHVAGSDGVHPWANGHLVMAYAFLKALGCDGDIGTITVDLAAGTATATEGHSVLSAKGGTVELESARYPFCFFGDPKDPRATRGIIEFLPFNDEPFCAPFQKVEHVIRAQQHYETPLIKKLIDSLPAFKQMVPDEAEALDRVRAGAAKRAKALFDASAAAVVPVRHTLRLE